MHLTLFPNYIYTDICPIFEIAYFSFWQNPFFILDYSFQCKYHLPLSLPFFFNFHFFLWSQKRKRKRKKKKKKNGCHVLLESWFIKFRQSGPLSKSKKAYFKQQYKKMAEKNLSLRNFLFLIIDSNFSWYWSWNCFKITQVSIVFIAN